VHCPSIPDRRRHVSYLASPCLKFLVPFSDSRTTVALLTAPVLGALLFCTAAVGLAGSRRGVR